MRGVGPFGYESYLVFCKDQGATIKLSQGGQPIAPFVTWRRKHEDDQSKGAHVETHLAPKNKTAPEVAEEEDLEWQTTGHRWLNQRVVRVFDEQHIEGTVTGWMPPNPNDATEPALFHIRHDDGLCSFALLVCV